MSLQKIKNMKAEKGFTIVELLIVIVIIGILAAITIVAYNGIQNRGKAAAGQSLANSVVKKAEAYGAVKGVYVDLATLKAVTTDPNEAKLDDPDVVVAAGVSPTFITAATVGVGSATAKTAGNGQVVAYQLCSPATNGAVVHYWDATTSGSKSIKVGTGC